VIAAHTEAALDEVATETTHEIDRLRSQAATRMMPLVDAATEAIWRTLPQPMRKESP
jgi:hypothetical protein